MAESLWELVTKEDFDEFAIDTAYVLSDYDFSSNAAPSVEKVVCVTTGDISINHTKTTSNHGDDVNGINGRFKELEYVESSETTVGFTSLTADAKTIAMALGCATINDSEITTRDELRDEDFKDVVIVGKKKGGGLVGAKLSNTFSTGGLAMTFSKNAKGNHAITLTAFKSIANPNEVPIKFYSTTASVEHAAE